MLDLILALFLGIIAGTFTGLFPGIHINLIASILLASLTLLGPAPLIALAVFIVAMSITHTFIDFIPSIFFGAPEEDSFLSVLPGHRMLLEGKGHAAYVTTIYGSLIALAIIIIFTPLYVSFLPSVFSLAKSVIPFILIIISFYLIFREGKIFLSLLVFVLAGFLGFLTFNLPVEQPLLPLLSGLFGLSALAISLKTKSILPKQQITRLRDIKLTKKEFFKSLSGVLVSAPFCSFLPGIGSGHAATIGSEIIPQNTKGFLFLVGATNTIIMGLSFITIYAIDRARSGSAAALSELLGTISPQNLVIIMAAMLISGIIAAIIGINISKFAAKNISRINYKALTLFIVLIIVAVNIFLTNPLGLLVLATATCLGIFTISSKSRRINLMGALILPVIFYYLF